MSEGFKNWDISTTDSEVQTDCLIEIAEQLKRIADKLDSDLSHKTYNMTEGKTPRGESRGEVA